MDTVGTYVGKVSEDGSYSVLARVCSLTGTGTQVRPSEGNCLTPADVSTITCKVFNLGTNRNNPAGTPVTPDPVVDPAQAIFQELRVTGWPTAEDADGYNFRHDVDPLYTADPDVWYLLEYRFILTAGGTLWLRVKVKTQGVQSG